MNNGTSLHIPTPCNEDWNKMTPTAIGKFCDGCSKQVIDFSMMSDQQILNYISQQPGKLCGRFSPDQLARPLVETKMSRKRSWWLAMALPFTLLFQKSFGQTKSKHIKQQMQTFAKPSPLTGDVEVMGAPLMINNNKKPVQKIKINGTVRDEFGNAVAAASVMIKGTSQGVLTDSTGRFSLDIESPDSSVTIVAFYIGYEMVEKQIIASSSDSIINLTLTTAEATLGAVTVGYVTKKISGIAGGISICKKITTVEKVDSAFKKLTKTQLFTAYPNPAKKGSSVYIKIKEAGSYELQLLSNNSNLIKSTGINNAANAMQLFQLPSGITSGVYYFRLLNIKNKKSDLAKIVVD